MSAARVAKKVCCPSRCVAALIPAFAFKHPQSVAKAPPCRSMIKQMQLQLGMSCQLACVLAWLDLQEPSTCHYVLTVAVPGLCQLPIFKAKAELVTQIVCHPVAASAAEALLGDPGSQQSVQQRHASFADDDLVKEDDSSRNSTNLEAS